MRRGGTAGGDAARSSSAPALGGALGLVARGANALEVALVVVVAWFDVIDLSGQTLTADPAQRVAAKDARTDARPVRGQTGSA